MVALVRRHGRPFESGWGRLFFRRPHIGPHDAAALDAGIGCQRDLLAETALRRLRRNFEACAFDIEFPAVIGAADTALFVAAEPQRYAAVGAEFLDQAEPALAVAKRQQAFGVSGPVWVTSLFRSSVSTAFPFCCA